jgi:amidase
MTNRLSRIEAPTSTRESIERIERLDSRINAVVVRDFERSHPRKEGPLEGWIVTVKESFDVEGLATTLGMRANAVNVATTDSEVVRRLRAAGAIIVGKTNVSAMLADFATDNELFGRTSNPHDLARGVGGSSGGSAASIAAGFARLDVGTDLGGSLRNPAHYCGVFAHKPTFGLVPMRGHGLPSTAPDPDMAVAGPLATNADDLRRALEVLAGNDSRLRPRRRPLRAALWPDDPFSPVDGAIAASVVDVGAHLAELGFVVSDVARPAFDPSVARATFSGLVRALWSGRDALANDEQERDRIRVAWRRFFEDWDVLLCPVTTTCARPHDDPPPLADIFWASLATLAYLPATVFPAGLSSAGLPIGVQAIGSPFTDMTTIELARIASGARA